MHKKRFLLTACMVFAACHYSGHLNTFDEPGGVRAGSVPYRTDGSESATAARKDDALRKIEKYCRPDSYTIVKEEASTAYPQGSNAIQFRCGEAAAAPAAPVGQAQPAPSAAPAASPGAIATPAPTP
jgi:hypothetical protein